MKVDLNDEVVLDLIPLYLSRSASAATRQLVEQYLAAHPETAARLAAQVSGAEPRAELAALQRTRHALRQRDFMLAFAIACTLAPLTFWFESGPQGGHVWMLLRTVPSLAMAFWAAATGFWVGYWIWSRRTRATGL